ncbi:MAG: hypothetical protein SF339_29530 [Blastocatellia bacterium]|nr:hypothetical protein [Blastocatellia bacterium]
MRATLFFMIGVTLLLGLSSLGLAQNAKPAPCGTDIPLVVTFRDFTGNPTPAGDKLYGDRSAYVDGTNKVSAVMQVGNCSFDFTFNLNTTPFRVYLDARDVNKIADGVVASPNQILSSQFFNFDRIAHIPLTPTTPIGVLYDPDSDFGRFCNNANLDTRYNVQYGGCQQDLLTGQWYVRRAVTASFSDSARGEHPFRFQKPPEGQQFTSAEINTPYDTSYVRVYHPSNDAWVLTPENAPYGGPVATLFNSVNRQYLRSGQFLIPFQLTLTRK